jgi:hypothetical protein
MPSYKRVDRTMFWTTGWRVEMRPTSSFSLGTLEPGQANFRAFFDLKRLSHLLTSLQTLASSAN